MQILMTNLEDPREVNKFLDPFHWMKHFLYFLYRAHWTPTKMFGCRLWKIHYYTVNMEKIGVFIKKLIKLHNIKTKEKFK